MYCSSCGKQIAEDSNFCDGCGSNIITNKVNEFYGVASKSTRLAHLILDNIFSYFIFLAIGTLMMFTLKENIAAVIMVPFTFLYFFLYYLVPEFYWQKTIGKLITKTKVVREDGNRPTFGQILIRTLARLIPFEVFSFLFTPIGWHDSLSKTIVVPKNYEINDIKKIRINFKVTENKTNPAITVIIVILFCLFIIGFMATLGIENFNNAKQKSRDAKRVSDITIIDAALHIYYEENMKYPERLLDLVPKYIDKIPSEVEPVDGNCSIIDNFYKYTYIDSRNYTLSFCLGVGSGKYSAGKTTLTSN